MTMAETAEGRETAAKLDEALELYDFKNDRLIKIYIADDAQPLLIQTTVLCKASKYFVGAIKNEHLGTGNEVVLRFPEDKEAWRLVIFWICTRKLPTRPADITKPEAKQRHICYTYMSLLVRSWLVADQYLMPDLQNELMLELAVALDNTSIDMGTVVLAFRGTNCSSPLCRIAAEELVHALKHGMIPISELSILDGATDTGISLYLAHMAMDDDDAFMRFEDVSCHWQNYMVRDGAVPHYDGDDLI